MIRGMVSPILAWGSGMFSHNTGMLSEDFISWIFHRCVTGMLDSETVWKGAKASTFLTTIKPLDLYNVTWLEGHCLAFGRTVNA